ncbi:TIM barrel protein [Streptosporangium lutulentum]
MLNALYGNRAPELSSDAQHDLALSNLSRAAEAAAGIGATVVVEALNSYESPTYPIVSSAAAFEVIDRVGAANVAFLADLYHLHRMGEDVLALIDENSHRFGHVQFADDPGRGQPGTGAMPYDQILDRLRASEYRGNIGLEYRPVGPSAESFGWADRWMPGERAGGAGGRSSQETPPSAEHTRSGE